jgi:hypothetical protein
VVNPRTAAAALVAMAALSIGLTVDYITAGATQRTGQAKGTARQSATTTTTTTSMRSESHTTMRNGVARCSVRIVTQVNGRKEVRTDRDRGTECSAHAELSATTTESRSGRP